MTKLVDALRSKDTRTENGMVAHSTTLNFCVDLFGSIGGLRGKDKKDLIVRFSKAFGEDPLTAMRLLFWTRDARGGAGERQISIDIMLYLAENKTEVLRKNLNLVTLYGRWHDLLPLLDTRVKNDVLELISEGLNNKDGLCAKWMPRPNVKNREKKRWAKAIMKFMGMGPKEYRKMLAENSNTVEQLMCAKEWDKINYSHVPSKAMSNYMKAYTKNDTERFQAYLDSLEKGEGKINAGAIYPYDVIKNLRHGNPRGANAQWEALPNFFEGSKERVLPMVDVSGSMFWPEAKVSGDLYAGHIAQSLGLYVSQRNTGPFKDAVMQFATNPKLEVLKGDLIDRYNQLQRIGVGGSTNIEAAFKTILDAGVRHNVPADEMPTMIIIFSDMQFNRCVSAPNNTAQEMIERMYREAGYEVPKVVFWQLNARGESNPTQYDKSGTALVSGFSTSILASLLGGKEITPYAVMMETLGADRYAPVRI